MVHVTIFYQSNHGKEEDGYDENDKEVAEALGLQEDGEEEIETIGLEEHEEKKEVLWPEPPDVSTEAKRLVSAAIEQRFVFNLSFS